MRRRRVGPHPPRVLAEAGFCNPTALPKGPNGRNLCRWCKKECQRARMTFCGPECIHEWKLRSNPGYARRMVFERDQGKCALCSKDEYSSGDWDADHIVPVAEGGGSCGIDNLRTLCKTCHRRVTAELRTRLAKKKTTKKRMRRSRESDAIPPTLRSHPLL